MDTNKFRKIEIKSRKNLIKAILGVLSIFFIGASCRPVSQVVEIDKSKGLLQRETIKLNGKKFYKFTLTFTPPSPFVNPRIESDQMTQFRIEQSFNKTKIIWEESEFRVSTGVAFSFSIKSNNHDQINIEASSGPNPRDSKFDDFIQSVNIIKIFF